MATVPAVGAVAWWRKAEWGAGTVLFGMGLYLYAALNAMGWAVVNDRIILVPLCLSVAIVGVVAGPLLARPHLAARAAGWKRAVVMVVLVLQALSIYAIWGMYVAQGAVAAPLSPTVETAVPAFRDVGEWIMTSAALLGAWAWRQGAGWGPGLALCSLGMLLYAALNSMSHAVVQSAAWMALLMVTLAIVLAVARPAVRCHRAAVGRDAAGWRR